GRFAHVVQKYYPTSKVTVEGFADPAGSTHYNNALSKKRADAVRDYLTAQGGLTTNQIETIGYGKTRLVTPKAWGDQPGAELNRRRGFWGGAPAPPAARPPHPRRNEADET